MLFCRWFMWNILTHTLTDTGLSNNLSYVYSVDIFLSCTLFVGLYIGLTITHISWRCLLQNSHMDAVQYIAKLSCHILLYFAIFYHSFYHRLPYFVILCSILSHFGIAFGIALGSLQYSLWHRCDGLVGGSSGRYCGEQGDFLAFTPSPW